MNGRSFQSPACLALLVAFASNSLLAPVARAQEAAAHPQEEGAQRCAVAYEEAQRARARGAFREANKAAKECSQVGCNSLIVQECIKLFEQIQVDTPSMIFTARNGAGEELSDVKVQVDGEYVAERLDGRPIEMDPGPHTFRFEAAGLPPLETKHTARVGDRNRLIEVLLGDQRPPRPAATPGVPEPVTSPPVAQRRAGIPVGSIALGGVGLVSLGVFGYLRLKATSDYNKAATTCSPHCDPADTDEIRTKFQLSYVALGVGVASLSGAALLYVLMRNQRTGSESAVTVVPTQAGVSAGWYGRF